MFFMRHGQSVFNEMINRTGEDPGIPDAELTFLGKTQAEETAKKLTGLGITRIVSSPYTRALETAQIVAAHLKLPVEVERLIGEYRIYSCDVGSPTDELKKKFPSVVFNGFASADWWLPFPENNASLCARIDAFYEKWEACENASRTLFVSHYYFINEVTGKGIQNAQVVEARAKFK